MTSPYANNYTRPVPPPDVVFSQPGYYTPRVTTHPLSVLALVIALISVILVPGMLVAIVLAHFALRATRNDVRPGRGMSIAVLCLGYSWLGVWSLLFLTGAFG